MLPKTQLSEKAVTVTDIQDTGNQAANVFLGKCETENLGAITFLCCSSRWSDCICSGPFSFCLAQEMHARGEPWISDTFIRRDNDMLHFVEAILTPYQCAEKLANGQPDEREVSALGYLEHELRPESIFSTQMVLQEAGRGPEDEPCADSWLPLGGYDYGALACRHGCRRVQRLSFRSSHRAHSGDVE